MYTIIYIIVAVLFVLLCVKTGLGNSIKFLLKWLFVPALYGLVGFLIGTLLGNVLLSWVLGSILSIVGAIKVIKKGVHDLKD